MAELYLACATGLEGFEKLVVLKRIQRGYLCRPEFVSMFLDEARLGAMLHHSNIAQVYDIGSDSGTYYFTMEYVEGRSLYQVGRAVSERHEVLPLDHALNIIMGVVAGLHAAHELRDRDGAPLNVVHRDVSPGNILISFDGNVKLIDFGIAKAARRQTQTRAGVLKGKSSHMSPEQCRAQALDRRSDIFAVGILLYQMTLGKRPFEAGSDFETMRRIVESEYAAPRSLRPDYPEELERIIARCLEADADDRYQTAQELFVDLETFARQERLGSSPYALGAYVRELFPEPIAVPVEESAPLFLRVDTELPADLVEDSGPAPGRDEPAARRCETATGEITVTPVIGPSDLDEGATTATATRPLEVEMLSDADVVSESELDEARDLDGISEIDIDIQFEPADEAPSSPKPPRAADQLITASLKVVTTRALDAWLRSRPSTLQAACAVFAVTVFVVLGLASEYRRLVPALAPSQPASQAIEVAAPAPQPAPATARVSRPPTPTPAPATLAIAPAAAPAEDERPRARTKPRREPKPRSRRSKKPREPKTEPTTENRSHRASPPPASPLSEVNLQGGARPETTSTPAPEPTDEPLVVRGAVRTDAAAGPSASPAAEGGPQNDAPDGHR